MCFSLYQSIYSVMEKPRDLFKCRLLVKKRKPKLLVFVLGEFECFFQLVSLQESALGFFYISGQNNDSLRLLGHNSVIMI